MSDSSVSDTHSGGTARTVSQQTSPSHGTHSSSQSRQDNSSTFFTALFDYVAQGEDELSLQRGETVEVKQPLWARVKFDASLIQRMSLHVCFLRYIRSCPRIQKSQVTRDGGLERFMEKLVFFRPISSRKRKASIGFRRLSIKSNQLRLISRSCN